MSIIKCSIPEILNEISMINIKRIESLIYELRGKKLNFIEYITKYINITTTYYFCILNSEIIGMARCYPIIDNKFYDIMTSAKLTPSKTIFLDLFIINKKHRKKGFGSKLFNFIADDIKNKYSTILIEYLDKQNSSSSSTSSSPFWYSHNFKLIKTYPAYGSVANLCYKSVATVA